MFLSEKTKFGFVLLIELLFFLPIYANSDIKTEVLQKIKNGIPKWMTDRISKDLAHVSGSRITKSMIAETLRGDPRFFVLLKINNGKIKIEYNDKLTLERQYQSCLPVLEALNELNSYIPLPNLEVVYCIDEAVYYWLSAERLEERKDTIKCYIPVFSACKAINDINVVLIPDCLTLKSIKENILREIALGNSSYPWNLKKNMAFWRGKTTGGLYHLHNFEQFPRVKLIQLSKKFPSLIDARFNYFWCCNPEIQEKLKELQFMGETIGVAEHIKYKYQILIDGNTASWPRAFWQYQCNSVVFKQNSKYIVWHNDLFKPWIHYIPFNNDCSDLIDQLNWAINNDLEAEKIAQNANETAKSCLQYSDILVYFYALISEYAKLLDLEN